MKNFRNLLTLPVIAAGLLTLSATQGGNDSKFEGVVTYTISADGADDQTAAMMQNATTTIFIKGDMKKSVTHTGMMTQIAITDMKKPDDPIVLLDIMGNKYQLKQDASKKQDDTKPDIKYTDETKTIAGYVCHKAVATITDKGGDHYTSNIYYTTELPYDEEHGKIKGLKGFPLEFNMKQPGMGGPPIMITASATSVIKKAVPDSVFKVPAGYQLMTGEEMHQDLQSKMGGH
jgi:GLPGLI family protein